MIARYSARTAWQSIQDDVVIVDLEEHKSLGLNPVGVLVWSMIESHDLDDLVQTVAARFEVEPKRARADIIDFIHEMTERGLLDREG